MKEKFSVERIVTNPRQAEVGNPGAGSVLILLKTTAAKSASLYLILCIVFHIWFNRERPSAYIAQCDASLADLRFTNDRPEYLPAPDAAVDCQGFHAARVCSSIFIGDDFAWENAVFFKRLRFVGSQYDGWVKMKEGWVSQYAGRILAREFPGKVFEENWSLTEILSRYSYARRLQSGYQCLFRRRYKTEFVEPQDRDSSPHVSIGRFFGGNGILQNVGMALFVSGLSTCLPQDSPKQPPVPDECASLRESDEYRRAGEQRRFLLYLGILAGVFLCGLISWRDVAWMDRR